MTSLHAFAAAAADPFSPSHDPAPPRRDGSPRDEPIDPAVPTLLDVSPSVAYLRMGDGLIQVTLWPRRLWRSMPVLPEGGTATNDGRFIITMNWLAGPAGAI